jgi:hypothetical protein
MRRVRPPIPSLYIKHPTVSQKALVFDIEAVPHIPHQGIFGPFQADFSLLYPWGPPYVPTVLPV